MLRVVLRAVLAAAAAVVVLVPPAAAGAGPEVPRPVPVGPVSDTPFYTLYEPVREAPVETLLVVFPGGFLPAASQRDLARAVQAASGQRLWVGVAKFTGDLATPAEGTARIAQITAAAAAAGFTTVGPDRTFLAGHSLGGVMASVVGQAQPVRGLLLWAAYVPRLPGAPGLLQYPRPVLTLAGSLDGRSRVTRPGLDAGDVAASGLSAQEAARTRAVVVVDGANHASFGDGAPLSNDFPAELTTPAAHTRIAALSSAFLDANAVGVADDVRARAVQALQDGREQTLAFLGAFLRGVAEETGGYCATVQGRVAALGTEDEDRLSTLVTRAPDAAAFAAGSPAVAQGAPGADGRSTAVAGVVARAVQEDRTGDQPSVPASARQTGCRVAAQASVEAVLDTTASDASPDCAALNEQALRRARSQVTAVSRKRFDDAPRQVRFLPDVVVSSPEELSQATLTYRTAGDGALEVGSPRYDSPGERGCQLLSPARAAEVVLVDGLRPLPPR